MGVEREEGRGRLLVVVARREERVEVKAEWVGLVVVVVEDLGLELGRGRP